MQKQRNGLFHFIKKTLMYISHLDDDTMGLNWNAFQEIYQQEYLGRLQDSRIDLGFEHIMDENLYYMRK